MTFLDEVKRSLTTTGLQVAKKTKEITDTVQLKAKIASEKETESRIFAEIGKKIYEMGEEADRSRFADEFASLKESMEKREALEAQLAELDKNPVCGSCGAKLTKGAAFCSRCGARVEHEDKQKKAEEECAACENVICEEGNDAADPEEIV